ncbi:MAG: hypothetical protein HONDAALG_02632 [Gammaproteobacteria bacterium]|nr:hypothetical protein [Gammaproteobacteria bacterium]
MRLLVATIALAFLSLTVLAQGNNPAPRQNPYSCPDANKGFGVTSQSLKNMKSAGVPQGILDDLKTIKSKEAMEKEEDFLALLKTVIKAQLTDEYKSLILKHARKGMTLRQIRQQIEARRNNFDSQNPYANCELAELLKRVGSYEAEKFYRDAITAAENAKKNNKVDEIEPAFDLFYAEYLRNFRGPQRPLFGDAERHYFEAWKKLSKIDFNCPPNPTRDESFDCETKRRLERGLVALYQRDGFPLWHGNLSSTDSGKAIKKPSAFFSSINTAARLTTDPERISDVRDFTAEASFSSSEKRLNGPLTKAELQSIIRFKDQVESINRLRLRFERGYAFDFSYKYRAIDDAQITNFYVPDRFNDLKLREFEVAVEKTSNFSSFFDLFVRGAYRRAERRGLIEFNPNDLEKINHYEANTAISRFFGPDKASLELVYVYNDIDQKTLNPLKRDRSIMAGKLTYQLLRPVPILKAAYENRFETRGLDLTAGALRDKERFGPVDITRHDYFVGMALKGIGKKGIFDVAVQPTIFTADVEGDSSQQHSQYRTNVSLLCRILDEEARPNKSKPAFLHLVIPFSYDVAQTGRNDFENYKIGVSLNAKFFSKGDRRTTFLASIRYDFQDFHRLDKRLNLISLNFSMGF